MKKILMSLILFALVFAGCKKGKPEFAPQPAVVAAAPAATVTTMLPSEVSEGMMVIITGTNFGSSVSDVIVSFAGTKAIINTVKPTEITAVVPTLSAPYGEVIVNIGKQTLNALTYKIAVPIGVYSGGNIALGTQAQVDTFVVYNKGKQLQINGNLTLGMLINTTPDIHDISGLSNITTVTGSLTIINCPQLTDVSPLSNITYAGNIYISGLGAASVVMDKLTSTKSIGFGGAFNTTNNTLTKISFKSLASVAGSINMGSNPQLATVDFSALTILSGKLGIRGTLLTDLKGFVNLHTAGSLTISNNSSLISLQGLELLTALSEPALNSSYSYSDISALVGGLYISGNPKLTSLSGLQNLSPDTVPIIYITDNTALNDLCPLKGPINTVNKLKAYKYKTLTNTTPYIPEASYIFVDHTLPALTIINNSRYAATFDALAAVATCK